MEKLLKTLCGQLHFEFVHGSKQYESEIQNGLQKVFEDWILSYDHYHLHSGGLLECMDRSFERAQVYLLTNFLNTYRDVVRLPVAGKMDLSVLNTTPPDNVINTYKKILESREGDARFSDINLNVDSHSPQELDELLSMLLGKLENDASSVNWDERQLKSTMSDLMVIRAICKHRRSLPLFYHSLNIFFDKLFYAERHQLARNLAEEMLYTSFKDNLCYYGFFVCFKVYANLGSNIPALLYGLLFLFSVKKESRFLNDKLLYETVWHSMRFFRNANLFSFGVKIYESLPRPSPFSDYERHALDLTYYSTLLKLKKRAIVSELVDYLGRERELILAEGPKGFSRWLLFLNNIKRIAPELGLDTEDLNFYVHLFGGTDIDKNIRRQQEIVSGNSHKLKDYLKESLLKLAATNFKRDLVFDNTTAVTIAHRMIAGSFKSKDYEAVMLAMIALTDFSMLFSEHEVEDLVPIAFDGPAIDAFYDQFANPLEFVNTTVTGNSNAMVWLPAPENKLFVMSYQNNRYEFHEMTTWNLEQFQAWSRETVPEMDFETSIKTRYGDVRGLLPEDYEEKSRLIRDSIAFPRLQINEEITELLLVRDIELSGFPHNLLLDAAGQFIGLKSAITDIISLDWLERRKRIKSTTTANSCSAWFPIDASDSTINFLYRKCERLLEDRGVALYETTKLNQPLSSVINIISSHGGRNIGATHVVWPEQTVTIYNLDRVVGEGKILIMLVCFSGSAQKDFFRNEIASLVKKYLVNGYEAVIAPFWALHIDIPPVWMPVFLDRMREGKQISQAVFEANRAVHDKYPTPAAWAAMHLYGNPYFQIEA